MPDKALHFCKHPGCSELTNTTYCEVHTAEREEQLRDGEQDYDRKRGSAASRGYDADWREAREYYLKRHPLCERCLAMGKVEAAQMVHHKKALRDGGTRLDPDNMMALCNSCHEIVEARGRFRGKRR